MNTEHHLTIGSHDTFEEGSCLLELVAHLAGDAHSDSPACVLPPLAAAGRGLNDCIEDDARRNTLLLPLAPLMLDTSKGDAHKVSLEWADWTTRVYLPAWLDLVPTLAEHAAALRALDPMTDENAASAGVVVRRAGDAATAAATAAAEDAASDAVWAAGRTAAWDAAMTAAWAAGRAAAWAAAWAVARDAAMTAAWAAARAAARAAAGAACDASTEGGDALAPTVTTLQDTAVALLRRQCEEAKR